MSFPQYRKLTNKSYYKIISENEMTEIQCIGQRVISTRLEAKTFLDRNLIANLLEGENGRYEVISEDEYEALKNRFI